MAPRALFAAAAVLLVALCAGAQGRALQEDPAGAPMMPPSIAPSPSVGPEMMSLPWGFPSSLGMESFPDMMAKVGDTVEFVWEGMHGVALVPGPGCPASFDGPDVTVVGPPSDGGTATFTFEEPGEYVFACQVGQHCAGGMIVKITVA